MTKVKLPVLLSFFPAEEGLEVSRWGEVKKGGDKVLLRGEKKDGLDIQSCLKDGSLTYISSCFIEIVII